MKKITFTEKVYSLVRAIPAGSTLSYGDVAERIGAPGTARAVGTVLRKNFDPAIPCHRVIRADGKPGKYNRGTQEKVSKLRAEGVLLAFLLCCGSVGYAKQHKRTSRPTKHGVGVQNLGGVIASGPFRLEGNYVVSRGGISMSGATMRVFAEGSQVRGNLGNSHCAHAQLTQLDMQGLDFQSTDLSGADFSGTELKGAKLAKAQVKGAHFEKSYGLTAQQKNDLKKRGAFVSMQDPKRVPTGLVAAVANNDTARALQLLKAGADVNEVNSVGNTGVIFAVDNKNEELLIALLNHKARLDVRADNGATPLLLAAMNGWTRGAELLCAHGANPNYRTEAGEDALMYAAYLGNATMVQLLLRNGADPSWKNSSNIGAVEVAYDRGHPELAELIAKWHERSKS